MNEDCCWIGDVDCPEHGWAYRMSAKPCNRCGGVIVFGKEQETGRIIPLSVGAKVYRVVRENIVTLDPKALVPHVCSTQHTPAMPPPDRDFTQPKSEE